MQATAIRLLAVLVLVSLLLPWPSDELWFTLAMAVLALNALLLAGAGIAAGVLGCAMLLLTSLLLRQGGDGGAGGAYVALAAEAGLIGLGVVSAIAAHRRRA